MKFHNYFCILFCSFLFSSCMEKRTINPIKSYKYWAGSNPSKNIEILNGNYWESAHFTKEYILYLEMKTSKIWIEQFIKINHLKLSKEIEIDLPADAPFWFKPKEGLKVYISSDYSQGSIYFVNAETGYILIYEIQI